MRALGALLLAAWVHASDALPALVDDAESRVILEQVQALAPGRDAVFDWFTAAVGETLARP
jgi:hypothetical protein